jgi:hypothetical protein
MSPATALKGAVADAPPAAVVQTSRRKLDARDLSGVKELAQFDLDCD